MLLLFFGFIVILCVVGYFYVPYRYNQWLKNKASKLKRSLGYKAYSDQFIYIIHAKDNIYKIGKTTNLYKRMQTHQTAHLHTLKIVAIVPVKDCNLAEVEIHNRYKKVSKREYFKVPLSDIKAYEHMTSKYTKEKVLKYLE